MKILLRIVGALVLVAAVVGGVLLYRNRTVTAQTTGTSGTYTQIVTAQRGNLSSALTVVGELDAVQRADLAFEKLNSATTVQKLNVVAGNTVKAGDVLAAVDPAAYQQALDQAKSDLAASDETLADLQTPATETEIAQADLAVTQAEQQLAQAKADLADLQSPDSSTLADLKNAVLNAQEAVELAKLNQTLTENGSTAKNERNFQYAVGWHERKLNDIQQLVSAGRANREQTDAVATEQESLSEATASLANAQAQHRLALQTAAAAVTAAQATLADAQEALVDAQGGGDALALAKAQLAVKTAGVTLASSQEARAQLDEGANATDLAAAQADVDKKRLALADAEAALAATNLTAPFDGTILEVKVNQGDMISSGATILTLANLNQLEVLASIDETTVRSVAAGQTAQATFDALPGQTLSGLVGEVPLQGTLQGDVMVYVVPITLAGVEKLPLLVGMTANVTISTGEAKDALLVPTMALTKANGLYQVLIADAANPSAAPQAVPVQIGLSDGTYTQITAGLNEGDQVVVEMSSSSTTTNFRGGMMMLEGGGGPPQPPSSSGSSSSRQGG